MHKGLAVLAMLVGVSALAAVNLNSSKSNAYRLTYPPALVTKAQAKAILADLDKDGRMDEARLKHWMVNNFRKYGIDGARVQKMIVMMPGGDLKEETLILLTNPADEAEARASSVKSSKSNSND